MNNQEEDKRGYDLKIDNFKNQLLSVINDSNISIGTAYYVIKDICNILSNGFENAASQQYKEFCEEANKEDQQEDKAE